MTKILFLLLLSAGIAHACTTVIISGKSTKDGRPLIWKNRDTGRLDNKLSYCMDGRHAFAGVFDVADTAETDCFMGSNDAGFCIINTASYNLKYRSYPGKMDKEGVLMRQALATCATLKEFEALLAETAGKRGVEANFGVIDAQGGAAYYETDPYAYTKFDVNDPRTAPHGYLVRTNFSFSGTPDDGQGYIRYNTANDVFYWGLLGADLTVETILHNAARSLTHSLTGANLLKSALPLDASDKMMIPFADFIPRYSTASSLIMQGVKKGEDPSLTTLWLMLGNPIMTPVVPVWVAMKADQPAMLRHGIHAASPLTAAARQRHARAFTVHTPEGERYMDLAPVLNQQRTGTLQRVAAFDAVTVREAGAMIGRFRANNGLDRGAISDFYRLLESRMKQLDASDE